jgi:hypothetical protein
MQAIVNVGFKQPHPVRSPTGVFHNLLAQSGF